MLHRPTQHKPGILHSNILLDLILVLATQTNAVKSVVDRMFFICRRVSARFQYVQRVLFDAKFDKECGKFKAKITLFRLKTAANRNFQKLRRICGLLS